MTRDIAAKMNAIYGNVFVIPEASILPTTATIPGLDGQKMSKSYNNTIALFDEENALRKKIMSIPTDSTPMEAPKDPAGSTIVSLYRLFANEADVAQMEADFRAGGIGYDDFKKRLFGAVWGRAGRRCSTPTPCLPSRTNPRPCFWPSPAPAC